MLPWNRDTLKYVPILSVKWGEMTGLEFLPIKDRLAMCPIIQLRRWANSGKLENTVMRVRKALGDKGQSFIADLHGEGPPSRADNDKSVHRELRKLFSSKNDYAEWCDYIEQHEDMIPTFLAGTDVPDSAIEYQLNAFQELGRGMVLRLREDRENGIGLAEKIILEIDDLDDLLIVIDMKQIKGDLNLIEACSRGWIEHLCKIAESKRLNIVCAGTSFPHEFDGGNVVKTLPILERELFSRLERRADAEGWNCHLIYGDYGSARAVEKGGWAGPPRIDCAMPNSWLYSRQPNADKEEGLEDAADQLLAFPDCSWLNTLQLWGAEQIRRASREDLEGLMGISAWPAVRINLHLYVQANFGNSALDFHDTEEDYHD